MSVAQPRWTPETPATRNSALGSSGATPRMRWLGPNRRTSQWSRRRRRIRLIGRARTPAPATPAGTKAAPQVALRLRALPQAVPRSLVRAQRWALPRALRRALPPHEALGPQAPLLAEEAALGQQALPPNGTLGPQQGSSRVQQGPAGSSMGPAWFPRGQAGVQHGPSRVQQRSSRGPAGSSTGPAWFQQKKSWVQHGSIMGPTWVHHGACTSCPA